MKICRTGLQSRPDTNDILRSASIESFNRQPQAYEDQ